MTNLIPASTLDESQRNFAGDYNAFVGRKFDRLTVLQFTGIKQFSSGQKHRYYECSCDCGLLAIVNQRALISGTTKSCGCLQKEETRKRCVTHGHSLGKSRSSTYRAWQNMWSRCTLPSSRSFPIYGGRGVSVCDRWKDFSKFLEDIGVKPSGQHSLDRFDVNGNYCPENCHWATATEQARNKRTTVFHEFRGKRITLPEICEIVGKTVSLVDSRLRRGWSLEDAVILSKGIGNRRGEPV